MRCIVYANIFFLPNSIEIYIERIFAFVISVDAFALVEALGKMIRYFFMRNILHTNFEFNSILIAVHVGLQQQPTFDRVLLVYIIALRFIFYLFHVQWIYFIFFILT